MKYFFWFFFALCTIAFLKRNDKSDSFYQPTSSSYSGDYTQFIKITQDYQPVVPSWQGQEIKSLNKNKKFWKEPSDEDDYPPEIQFLLDRADQEERIDWQFLYKESKCDLNTIQVINQLNKTKGEKQQRVGSGEIDEILKKQNTSWVNVLLNLQASAYAQNNSAQTLSGNYGSGNNPQTYYSVPNYSTTYYQNETYNINGTEYYNFETYKTTGRPKVKRSMTARNQFLRSLGHKDLPDGYEVDHIIPLSKGGSDTPDNMQLLTVDQHKLKTARERANTSSSDLPSLFFSTSTTQNIYRSSNTTLPNTNPIIYTGPRGGQYYINSNGNKTYINKN